MKKMTTCLFIMLFISACGWHVRGAIELPKNLSQLYVSAVDSKGALITELRQLLKSNRVSLVENESEANYSLNITNENKDRRSTGVGGDALSSSYDITLKAEYEIRLKNSNEVTKATAISVRSFNYNTGAINSATQEEILLDQEMRRDVAQQMLRRLNAVVVSSNNEKLNVTPSASSKAASSTSADSSIGNPSINSTENGKTAP
jgi:LPS-assembly lipoprotein